MSESTDLWGALRRQGDTGTVTLRRRYPTDVDDLWSAVTEPDRLARWFAPVQQDGENHVIVFDADDPNQRTTCRVLDCDPPTRLRITWQNPGEDHASQVEITLAAAGDGTDLTLVHSGLPHDSDVGHAAGWEVYLRFLQASLNGEEPGDWWAQWQSFRDTYRQTV